MSTVATKDGRVFELLRKVSVRKRPWIKLLLWQGSCAVCGAPFTVSTPVRFEPQRTNSFGRKHCDEHKLTRAQVFARAKGCK